jgi:hypothetical protein
MKGNSWMTPSKVDMDEGKRRGGEDGEKRSEK